MAEQELELQEKQELQTPEEPTRGGTSYLPYTDIHEADDRIVVSMDMPGVGKGDVDVELEKNVLTVVGRVDHALYDGMTPAHIEYNVGNFTRRFTVSNAIDRDAISASVDDGVLTIVLPKAKEAAARRIEVG